MLERVDLSGLALAANTALNPHEYQYHGPDPDLALSRYRTREEAAANAVSLMRWRGASTSLRPRSSPRELDAGLEELKREVGIS